MSLGSAPGFVKKTALKARFTLVPIQSSFTLCPVGAFGAKYALLQSDLPAAFQPFSFSTFKFSG
jgi:hypothetical protein